MKRGSTGCMAMAVRRMTKMAASIVIMAMLKRNAPEVCRRCQRPTSDRGERTWGAIRSRAKRATMMPTSPQHGPGQQEGAAGTEAVVGNASQEWTARRAGEDRRLHHAEGVAEPWFGGAGGDQGRGGGHRAGQRALRDAKRNQLPRRGGEAHQGDDDRPAEKSAQQHRLASVAIGQDTP